MLAGLENRFARIQPIAPVVAPGGGIASTGAPRTKALVVRRSLSCVATAMASPFHQRDARVVPVHHHRGDEADREIDRHGDHHDLDRLAGLVEHRAGEDLHEVGIADERPRARSSWSG